MKSFCDTIIFMKGIMNMEEKKRKHHYVFQSYLLSWTNNKQIWCYRNQKKFQTNTINIAQERDFYRLKPLNVDEYKLYQLFIKDHHPAVKNALNEHLNAYITFEYDSKLIEIMKRLPVDETIQLEIKPLIANLEEMLDIAKNNCEEDYYSEIEGELNTFLNSLKQYNLDFYYQEYDNNDFDNDKFHFLFDVCVQMFRTKATKQRWLLQVQKAHDYIKDRTPIINDINLNNINFENLVPHYFWGFQNALAYNLYKENAHLTILRNLTERAFLTCDQPVINLKNNYLSDKSTKELLLYYPISPTIGILINDSSSDNSIDITDLSKIDYYNENIINASFTDVYSNSKDVLDFYIKT